MIKHDMPTPRSLHTFAGAIVMFENCWHALWHIVRWAIEAQMESGLGLNVDGSIDAEGPSTLGRMADKGLWDMLFDTQTGVTGFIMMLVLFPIAGIM